jgi:hypothetical protein
MHITRQSYLQSEMKVNTLVSNIIYDRARKTYVFFLYDRQGKYYNLLFTPVDRQRRARGKTTKKVATFRIKNIITPGKRTPIIFGLLIDEEKSVLVRYRSLFTTHLLRDLWFVLLFFNRHLLLSYLRDKTEFKKTPVLIYQSRRNKFKDNYFLFKGSRYRFKEIRGHKRRFLTSTQFETTSPAIRPSDLKNCYTRLKNELLEWEREKNIRVEKLKEKLLAQRKKKYQRRLKNAMLKHGSAFDPAVFEERLYLEKKIKEIKKQQRLPLLEQIHKEEILKKNKKKI